MTQWVDFAEVRSKVSLEDVLFRFYTINNLIRKGDKVIGPCPVHGGDSPRAFHADLSRNVWHCFSQCRRGGNQLDFVACKEDIAVREAALRLQQAFVGEGIPPPGKIPDSPPDQTTPVKSPQERQGKVPDPGEGNPPLKVHLKLKREHPHLVKGRGLTPETLEHFGIGYCSKGIMRGTIAIPIHDERGNLVAYAGRRLKPSDIETWGKYKLPKGFRKELVLFNLHRAKNEDFLILVEGYFSVFSLYQLGYTNVVAVMGCEISDHQAELLAQFKEVIVLFDGNQAGWSGAEAVKQKLSSRTTVRIARLPSGFEPEDLSPKALRWLIQGLQVLDLAEASFVLSPVTLIYG